jgi:hypothetical protein
MLTRIRNRRSHKNYSGRGIDIDPRWHKFEAFLADMGERPAGLTLERVDNDRGYWPDNCVWATSTVQGRNRRDVKLTYAIAEEIRYMFTTGSKVSELARRYKLNIRYTYAVIARKTWAKP